jgi:protein-arginine kinase activator protein McsA
MRAIHELREQLETAIREEAYEDAARLRDELAQMETRQGS